MELLEFEWPGLPPILKMKDAITRSRVSHGISYLLPGDEENNFINNHFRTDLRAMRMVQKPYASDDLRYDDSRLKLSAEVYFKLNTVDTKWTDNHVSSLPVEINSDSERVRKLYIRSAPSSGPASRRMGIDPCKLRKRSNLYLPIKAKVPPEAIKIRKEVERIIKSVQEDDGAFDVSEHVQQENHEQDGSHVMERQRTILSTTEFIERRKAIFHNKQLDCNQSASSRAAKFQQSSSPYGKQNFSSYDELRTAKPPRILIPDNFKSKFLDAEKNQQIWSWLHEGEELSDFKYFLSVCG